MHTLYFFRHGKAKTIDEGYTSDFDRELTEDGADCVKKAGKGLRKSGQAFDVILSSPLVRAKQTAEIFRAQCDPKPDLEFLEILGGGYDADALLEFLSPHKDKENILIVAHEPFLSMTAGRLIGGGRLFLKPGTMAAVEMDEIRPGAQGDLLWMMRVKQMGRLG